MSKTLSVDVPREIAGYKILNQIGEGGMARVFKGRNEVGGYAAVKVINPYYQHDPGFKERFRREAEALTQVEHEGVVRILQWVEENNTLAMIMEYLDGLPFNDHLDRIFSRCSESGLVRPDGFVIIENLRIMRDVAVAMSHVHRRGVCHRDLKPDNIIIIKTSRGNLPKIIDFGICHPQGSPRRTLAGVVIGTPGYMAPEQIIPSRDIDNRTDIFALGLILFEAYSGVSIFAEHSDELAEQYQLMRNDEFVVKRIEEEGIPPHVAPIIKRCLKFKIEERYPFMDQVVGALELSLEQEDHYLIGRVNLLTKKRNQRDIPTVESVVEVVEDGVVVRALAAAEEKANTPPQSEPSPSWKIIKQKILYFTVIFLLLALAVSAVLIFNPDRQEIKLSQTGLGGAQTLKAAEPAAARLAEKIPHDVFQTALNSCLAAAPQIKESPVQQALCLTRRARVWYEQGRYDQAYQLALKIESEYWNNRNWQFKKEARTTLQAVFRLLGKLYRQKASQVEKYSGEWDILSRRAAHYEQTVRNMNEN